jgi:hypothetical protein
MVGIKRKKGDIIMNIEGIIQTLEKEIDQLVMDKSHVVNNTSVRALQESIDNREYRIEYLKKKYLREVE